MPKTSMAALSVANLTRDYPEVNGRLVPPPWLTDEQKTVFDQTVSSVKPGHFRPCDLPVLVAYVVSYVNFLRASDTLDREGLMLGDGPHPMHKILREERTALSLLASRLRLTPASRRDGRTANTSTDLPQTGPLAALAYLERKHG